MIYINSGVSLSISSRGDCEHVCVCVYVCFVYRNAAKRIADSWGEKRKRDVVFHGATLSEELWHYAQVESRCEYWCSENEYICINTHTHRDRHALSSLLGGVCSPPDWNEETAWNYGKPGLPVGSLHIEVDHCLRAISFMCVYSVSARLTNWFSHAS